MKRILFPALGLSLALLGAGCSSTSTSDTANSTTGNANNTAEKSMTTGDAATATMPADAAKPENQPAAAGTATPTTGKGDPNGPTAPHATDEEFMKSAAHSDQNEIQLSKLALSKGVTGMAKQMADKMIADHTKSTADLKAIAAKKKVTLPTDMDPEHKALKPTMEKLSGKAFEEQYLKQMVTDHQKTANTMVAHQQMTKDTELQGFITKTLPVVESHLQMAEAHSNMKM